jgi:outer membrane immunogenic protein
MKSLLVAGFALLAGLVSANAADLPIKAPVPVVAPFSWTGFYVGGQVGGGVIFDAGWVPRGTAAGVDRHGIGALAGGQIGANYQVGMLVLGIEGEGFWSSMQNTVNFHSNSFAQVPNSIFATAHVSNRWDAAISGRFGVAFDRALVYGKAGWVWGGFDWNYNQPLNNFTLVPFPSPYTETASATLDGLLIGIGLEYAFDNHWTAKFEYDYLGFSTKDVLFTTAGFTSPLPPLNTYKQTVSADKHIFKVGVNYLFNAGPIVARY